MESGTVKCLATEFPESFGKVRIQIPELFKLRLFGSYAHTFKELFLRLLLVIMAKKCYNLKEINLYVISQKSYEKNIFNLVCGNYGIFIFASGVG